MSATRRDPPRRQPAGRRGASSGGVRGSDLMARVVVAVPAAVLAILFVALGGVAFTLFMVAVGWACLWELYRMLDRWRPLTLIGFAVLAGMVAAAHFGTRGTVLEVAMASIPLLFGSVLLRGYSRGATVAVAGTLLGIFWIGLAFAHAVLLRQLAHGSGVMIDVLVGTFLGDTAAYAGGRLFGRRPLAPEISPHKTVEGLYCGMLVTLVAVFVAGLFQPWLTQGNSLALGIAIAVLGPLGDLFESMVKREAGAKDAGTLFGAHGGALDRLDAVIFTIVAGYYVWLGVLR